ncbi:hypothetical protein ACJIZ3_024677 [Penstemon smallii]|uniref:AIPP2-like SPOC-like domain-containing protein n=1 Tax=Penstemon smallii TaxID=265156 RepID=A0ABD3TTV4_9LAMI
METICLQCGDKGCTDALEYCVKCRDFAVHRYCLDVIPELFEEDVSWLCDDCEEESQNKSSVLKDDVIPCETRDSERSEVETNKTDVGIVRMGEQVYEGALQQSHDACPQPPCESDAEPRVVLDNDSERSSKRMKSVGPFEANFEGQSQGTDFSTGPRNENEVIVLENRNTATEGRGTGTSTVTHQTSNSWRGFSNDLNTSSMLDCHHSCPEPIIRPVWRGSFNISNQKNDILNGLMAHISSKAGQKVYDEACQFQLVLHLEMLPRSDVWPKSFEISEPTSDNIALYFFPSEISERVFDQLLDQMVREELALRTFVKNAELLVFPSDLLPLRYWKFQGKYYLWGVFRGKLAPSHTRDEQVMHEKIPNGNKVLVNMKNRYRHSPRSPLSSSSSYCSGKI